MPNQPLQVTIEEKFTLAKTGRAEDNEDAFYIGSNFIAVIDGATTKSPRRWHGKTGGQTAARLIAQTLEQLSPTLTIYQAAEQLTTAIQHLYQRFGLMEEMRHRPIQRITASVAILSLWRREVWLIGDCQALLDKQLVSHPKAVDDIAARARALFLESELKQGKTIEQLRQQDTGRQFILPLLERQAFFQNSSESYGYPVVDGFPIPETELAVQSLAPSLKRVILATDGYLLLKESLAESEAHLQKILQQDPLLFRLYKSTKGIQAENVSFDDRTFIQIRLHPYSI